MTPAGSDSGASWSAVDCYIVDHLLGESHPPKDVLEANAAAGLPAIDVSPAQGKLLYLLARAIGARRILEVGTLGAYSSIWLAQALPADGRLITLEIDPVHAGVARGNLQKAGVGDKVEVRIGPALESIAALGKEKGPPFDLVFIDADKEHNPDYVKAAIDLARSGALIIVDNVVREGRVLDASSADPNIRGTRGLYEMLAKEPRLEATAIQTVGTKGWDGFVIGMVRL